MDDRRRDAGSPLPLFCLDCEQDPGTQTPPCLYRVCQSSVGEAGPLQHPKGRQVVRVSGCPHRGFIQCGEAEVEQEPGGLSRITPSPTVRAEVPTELAAVRSLDAVDSGPAAEALGVFNHQVVARSGIEVRLLKQPWQADRFG